MASRPFLNFYIYICNFTRYYDPLMMSQKESPRNHPGITHGCFLKKLPVWCEFPILGYKLTMGASFYYYNIITTRQGRVTTVGITQESPIVFCLALLCSRKHTSFPSKLNWAEIQTILSTFLGITQKAPMGDSWVIPSVTSLTDRSVCSLISYRAKEDFKNK